MEKIVEQIYNTSRSYYIGKQFSGYIRGKHTGNDTYESEYDRSLQLSDRHTYIPMIFLTPKLEYAIEYATGMYGEVTRKLSRVYRVKIKKHTNIFNARSEKDLNKFKSKIDLNEKELERLKNGDWYFVKDEMQAMLNDKNLDPADFRISQREERKEFLDIVKDLGYDGFFNFEGDNDPAVGLFSMDSIEIVDEFGSDWVWSQKEKYEKLNEAIDEADFLDFVRDYHEAGKFDDKTVNELKDYIHDHQKNDDSECFAKKAIKYENEDYLDIPDELKANVMADILTMLSNDEKQILEKIKTMYELSDSDAEEFVVEATNRHLNKSDIEPKDAIKDITDEEIEKSMNDALDDYTGPSNGVLEYLADTYEIEDGEAQKMLEESGGKIREAINLFKIYIKGKLHETHV